MSVDVGSVVQSEPNEAKEA
ncbi:hypothetical protein SEA_MANTRA_89 [Mycobacterium phage Mantra]|uniref:Uncharacterized protein n=1 Tax=Mycobacterium phage Mantra TaxID=2283297 RepID=A0A345MG31_9CAUD|nr:hypothetical protein I5H60_gp089 [Mycobacterium phage Mantra]AXH69512.1 hypothetical protein SEA_MANTRA_89 [Mycobacterium phage Mantra]